jgi:phosphoenolpyruvate carboxylase
VVVEKEVVEKGAVVEEEVVEEVVEEEEEEEEEIPTKAKSKYTPSVIYNKIIENCNIISSRILNDRMRSYAEGNSPYSICTSVT